MNSVKVERGSISMIVASTERIVSNLDVNIRCCFTQAGKAIYKSCKQ